MNRDSNESSWISVHIFFKGEIYGKECDEVILKIVEPLIDILKKDKLIEKFFFIRYAEYGPHVRLRLHGNSKTLNTKVKDEVEKFIEKNFLNELKFFPILPNNPPQYKNYLWIDYEPEIDRYGGEDAIKVAEEFFYHSSITTINMLHEIENGDKPSRLGKGLLTMLVLLKVFAEEIKSTNDWIKLYGKNYLKARAREDNEIKEWETSFHNGFNKQSEKLIEYISAVWNVLTEGGELNPALDYYKAELIKTKSNLLALLRAGKMIKNSRSVQNMNMVNFTIVSSYIHMMNNRLGILISEESYLAHLISNTLEKISRPATVK